MSKAKICGMIAKLLYAFASEGERGSSWLAAHRRKVLFSRPEVQQEMKDEKAFEPEMIHETCCLIYNSHGHHRSCNSKCSLLSHNVSQNIYQNMKEHGHQMYCP